MKHNSWGDIFQYQHQVFRPKSRFDNLPSQNSLLSLPFGLGRSYGDSCLNQDQLLIDTCQLDRFISFDEETGILRAEAGVSLENILNLIVPKGWFLPVTPGTKYVTLGGAIANDVHGKNHHLAGNFSHHVREFEVLKSSGERFLCSPSSHQELFSATIGGLGLTGLITWVEIQTIKISSTYIEQELIRFNRLRDFFELSHSSSAYTYTVAWIDALAPKHQLGRGIFIRGNHPKASEMKEDFVLKKERTLAIPFYAPNFTLNHATLKLFNAVYFHKPTHQGKVHRTYFDSFFYPLDSIGNWNRIYGKRGFFQYQCVVPRDDEEKVVEMLLAKIKESGQGSFLAVLKIFGDKPSLGMLSFPRPGVTLALDFANLGSSTLTLFSGLDSIVLSAGGALYPAKDARMSPEAFKQSYPDISKFLPFVDPKFSSSFFRRMGY